MRWTAPAAVMLVAAVASCGHVAGTTTGASAVTMLRADADRLDAAARAGDLGRLLPARRALQADVAIAQRTGQLGAPRAAAILAQADRVLRDVAAGSPANPTPSTSPAPSPSELAPVPTAPPGHEHGHGHKHG